MRSITTVIDGAVNIEIIVPYYVRGFYCLNCGHMTELRFICDKCGYTHGYVTLLKKFPREYAENVNYSILSRRKKRVVVQETD
jgi:hypothetical protein